jgi:hypothetical protein
VLIEVGNGVELVRLWRWMGHADIQTTMRCAHYVPAHDDAARLTAALNRGTELSELEQTQVPQEDPKRL